MQPSQIQRNNKAFVNALNKYIKSLTSFCYYYIVINKEYHLNLFFSWERGCIKSFFPPLFLSFFIFFFFSIMSTDNPTETTSLLNHKRSSQLPQSLHGWFKKRVSSYDQDKQSLVKENTGIRVWSESYSSIGIALKKSSPLCLKLNTFFYTQIGFTIESKKA